MTTQLPPQDPPEPDEKLPGETELAVLYRQLPHSEPSPALDAAVLRAAAQALAPDEESPTVLRERRRAERERGDWVHPKPVTPLPLVVPSPGSRSRPRWLIALSSAATLVLAAGLAWHMRELPPATSTTAATDSAAPAQAAAARSLPAATSPAATMQPAESTLPPPPEPAKQPPPKMVVAPPSAPAADALRKAAADQGEERSSKAKAIGALSRDDAAPMPAQPAPPLALQETSSNSVAAAPEAPTAMATAPAPAPSLADEATAPNTSDTPAQELDKIEQLFKQGHDDEARQRLTAFQHAHPQWDLPPELRAQLHQP